MTRADLPEAARRDFFLYVDEFQNFTTGSFASVLSEARKFRLSLICAHQYLSQLNEQTADAVWGNVGSIVSFQVGSDDAERLAPQLCKIAGRVTRNGIPIQPVEHVHVKRMALDPLADDWAEKLDVERYPYPTNPTASPLDSDSLDRIALDLTSAFEGVAQGQLEVVLSALDGVRGQILATLRHRRRCGG